MKSPSSGRKSLSLFHKEKDDKTLLSPHDAEFEARKTELWRRVKAAMNRWAQLRRMTKYGMIWLGEDHEQKEIVDEFKEKHGYDHEYVIVFPLVDGEDEDDCTSLLETKASTDEILKSLQECGIETNVFPSVQNDELFCTVRIPPNILGAFCEANGVELELNPEKLEKVVTEGSPPHEITAQALPHDETRCVYKPYDHIFAPYDRKVHDYFKNGVGLEHPFDRLIRLKLIPWMIQSDVELDKTIQGGAGLKLKELKEQGKINDFFPMHDEAMRQAVYSNWILRSTWPWALPVNLIRSYFGEKVSLFFSFAAHYTSWLLPLALLGFVAQMQVFQNGYDKAPLLLIFSAAVSVWPIFMLESWKRKEAGHSVIWGMANFTTSEAERPEFFGETRPSLVDGTPELYYPDWKRKKNILKSVSLSIVFISINLIIQILVFTLQTYVSTRESGEYQGYIITSCSVAISIQISLADALYKSMAITLTESENHLLNSEYYDSLILKFAGFQLFNNYSSFFYVGFVKPFFGIVCQSVFGNTNPCMQELGYLLGVVFISDIFSNIVLQVVVPRLKSKWRGYLEGVSSDAAASTLSSVAEQEAILEEYDIILDLLMDYKTINIQFGYLTFFVGALPILPVIAFAANVVEMRVDGHKLLREHRCPASTGASNIGMWQSVFISYGMAAVVSNSAIIFFSTDLIGTGDVTNASQVWFFFIFQYSVYAGMFLVAILVEDVPVSVTTQLERQEFFKTKVMAKLVSGGSDVLERFRDAALKLSKDVDGSGGIQKVFALLSIDGVSITAHSLKLGLNLIGFKTTELDMKILMNRLDADKSGVLDLDEFKTFVQSTTDNDVRLVCRRLRKKLAGKLEEVNTVFQKHDIDGSGSIDIKEMRNVLMSELNIVVSIQEAEMLSTRFDTDNDGKISLDEFNRFMSSELAVDKAELMLRLRKKFALFESNGMSVVKLFTASDKENLGLVTFISVNSIFKFMGVNLSSFEHSLIESNYASTMDSKLCRYTDLYSDIMTTEDDLEEEDDIVDTGPTLEESLREEEELALAMQHRNKDRMMLAQLDWHTVPNMATAFSRLAAEYNSIGDYSNAEALYQHAIFLSEAAVEETNTNTSISNSLYNSGNGLHVLGGFGTALSDLDRKLDATKSKLTEVINSNDHHMERIGPLTLEATKEVKARVAENIPLSQRINNIINSGNIIPNPNSILGLTVNPNQQQQQQQTNNPLNITSPLARKSTAPSAMNKGRGGSNLRSRSSFIGVEGNVNTPGGGLGGGGANMPGTLRSTGSVFSPNTPSHSSSSNKNSLIGVSSVGRNGRTQRRPQPNGRTPNPLRPGTTPSRGGSGGGSSGESLGRMSASVDRPPSSSSSSQPINRNLSANKPAPRQPPLPSTSKTSKQSSGIEPNFEISL